MGNLRRRKSSCFWGVSLGAAVLSRSSSARGGAKAGFLIGLLGPVNYLLWKMYNGITDRLGLDSVKNLLVNLAIFAVLGIAAGLISAKYWASRKVADESRDSPQVAPLQELGEGQG